MKKIKALLLICMSFFLGSCAKKYTPETLPDRYFSFGSGGGYAGTMKAYTLLDNGQIFQKTTAAPALQELDKVKRKTARQLYKRLDSLQIDSLTLNQPGNKFYFITQHHLGKTHTITWGRSDTEVKAPIENIYQQLNELTQSKK